MSVAFLRSGIDFVYYTNYTGHMTTKQLAALALVGPSTKFRDARTIGANGAILTTLAKAGLVERKWVVSSLRGGDHWTYRLSTAGWRELHRAQREANK